MPKLASFLWRKGVEGEYKRSDEGIPIPDAQSLMVETIMGWRKSMAAFHLPLRMSICLPMWLFHQSK
jgi:hypothetical protein